MITMGKIHLSLSYTIQYDTTFIPIKTFNMTISILNKGLQYTEVKLKSQINKKNTQI